MRQAETASKYVQFDQRLALSLAAGIRTAAYYDPKNTVLQESCQTLLALLQERAAEEGTVRVGAHSHCLFVNGARTRTSVSSYERFSLLVKLFESWQISTVVFREDLTLGDLTTFLRVIASDPGKDNTLTLASRLEAQEVIGVSLEAAAGDEGDRRLGPMETFVAAVQAGGESQQVAEDGTGANVRHIRHVTQAVVDMMMKDPYAMVALTTIKEMDEWVVTHSVNVSILAVLIGQRLGLSKARLGELCLAGFLHDIGKSDIAPEVLRKPGPLTPREWDEMRAHPELAARSLVKNGTFNVPSMRAAVVAFEHHMNYDMSGYPRAAYKQKMSLFGSIVAIADQYDALTTARPYRKNNFTPHETLAYMLDNTGTLYDPTLVKLFAEIMGLYPPGTVLALDNGDVGVVTEPPVVGLPLDRPKVRILTSERNGEIVDLSEQRADGEYAVSVEAVLNPANMGQMPAIDPATAFGPVDLAE